MSLQIVCGYINSEEMDDVIERFFVNEDENYIYNRYLARYAELNQDMYIWILQEKRLESNYYDENGNYVSGKTKFLVEGKKLTKAELPPLNLILDYFHIGHFDGISDIAEDNYSSITFNFPTATENRKFTIKIGRVTDISILSKIQNNDYSGIVELLNYAKTHDSIYLQNLTTTSKGYYRNDTALFDGRQLLQNEEYYYIYVEFDDENGKYFPIEGVTLGQAWISPTSDDWDLWAYTSSNFQWNVNDDTVAKGKLPQTGATSAVLISFVGIALVGMFCYKKYNKYKDIK